MARSPCCAKVGINKGAWSSQEDETLINYVKIHGEGKWRKVAQNCWYSDKSHDMFEVVQSMTFPGLNRCAKSCTLRSLNYLRPGIKRGDITMDEEDLIIRLHRLLGNRWALIAGRLPGRTDNEIKNYWKGGQKVRTLFVAVAMREEIRSRPGNSEMSELQDDESFTGQP